MVNPTLSDALKEAYASAPIDVVVIDTLSLYYTGLKDEEGVDAELYFFNGFKGDRRENGIPILEALLEEEARFLGGTVNDFIGLPFRVVLPDVTTTALSKGQLVIDGVGREVTKELQKAVEAGAKIEITYRAYLSNLKLEGPQNDPPLAFNISNVSANAEKVTGDISPSNIGNKSFPRELYTSDRFPSLVF